MEPQLGPKISQLKKLALEYSTTVMDEQEIQSVDMTAPFYHDIETSLIYKDPLKIEFKGKPASGKSTAAIALYLYILYKGRKLKVFPKSLEPSIKHIARSQQDADRLLRDTSINNCVIMTDELLDADETGQNITLIKAIRNQVSNVHAQRFIHHIQVTPKETLDVNSDIFLEVLGINKKEKTTRCLLYFNLYKGGVDRRILLGYVDISVRNLIKNYEKWHISDIIQNKSILKWDSPEVKAYRDSDLYVDYVFRKFLKMKLLTDNKIYQDRDLDYALLAYNVVQRLKALTKVSLPSRELVEAIVIKISRELDLPQTILGRKLNTDIPYGILKQYNQFYLTNNKILHYQHLLEKGLISPEMYELRKQILEDMKVQLAECIKDIENDQLSKIELRKKYMTE